jgi:hypothetical protein
MPKPHRKPGAKSPRPLSPEEHAAATKRYLERLDRRILRAVQEWAKLWEDCPNAGCRRNRRCLHEQACRSHDDAEWTEESLDAIRAWLAGDAPKYDGR